MDFFDREQIERLPAATIIKWIFLGAAIVCLPYQSLMGLLALFGYHTVQWGGRPVTGLLGLLVAPLLGLLATVMLTVFLGAGCLLARWIFSRLEPIEADQPGAPQDDGERES
jgi:hypothetical protein